MLTEQYSSAKDTINAIYSRLQCVHRRFAGAQVRVALFTGTAGPRFLTGTMVFAEQKLPSRPIAEYKQLRLVEFWIDDQDDAVNFLGRFFSGQENVSGIPILNTFPRANADHNPWEHAASGWPSWLYTSSTDPRNGEQKIHLAQHATVSMGLSPFLSPADAVRCWIFQEARCNNMAYDIPLQEQFLTVVPDTRVRFVSGRWSPGKLDLALEINTRLRDVELQVIHLGSEKRSATHPLKPEPMAIEIPEDAQQLVLYVVDRDGNLVCTYSFNGIHRSFGKFEDPETDNVDYARDLQRGENETREFKPFITPRSEKEFELVKTVVAFSNTDGGTLYVGVDDEGVPLGITGARKCFKKSIDPLKEQLAMLKSLVTENTKPVPNVNYNIVQVSGHPVVVAEVQKSPSICSTQDNRVFVRRGATSRLADPQTELPSLIKAPGLGLDFDPNPYVQ